MRKNILRVIAVIFLISIFVIGIAVLTACKKEEPKGPIYKLNEDNMTCSIERNADFVPEGDFIIPSIYEGKAVTKISENAFQNCTDLTSVTIPNSVVSIGKNAFNGCRSLTEVVIPSSVTNIGYGAFSVCSALRNITIPSSVTDIEEMVLERCYSLENVTVPYKLLPNLKKELAQIENLTISLQDDGVTEIEGCFRGYQHLKNVSIPESVTVIGDSTYSG